MLQFPALKARNKSAKGKNTLWNKTQANKQITIKIHHHQTNKNPKQLRRNPQNKTPNSNAETLPKYAYLPTNIAVCTLD